MPSIPPPPPDDEHPPYFEHPWRAITVAVVLAVAVALLARLVVG